MAGKKKDAAAVPVNGAAPAAETTAAAPAAAPKPTAEEKKAARALKAEEAAKKKAADKEAAKVAKEANRQPMQNGVRRPGPNGLCGQGWAIMDKISAAKGAPAAAKEVKAATDAAGLNWGNIVGEYAKWRKFHGLTGRIYAAGETPVDKETAKAAAKAAKEAAKAAKAAATPPAQAAA